MRFSTKQAASALSLIIAATMFCTVVAFQGNRATYKTADEKNPTAHAHTDDWEFYENVALLPVTVSEIDGNRVYWAFGGRSGIRLGSFDLLPGISVVPKGFDKLNHAGCYGMTYCRKHNVVYHVEPIPDKACNVVKQ